MLEPELSPPPSDVVVPVVSALGLEPEPEPDDDEAGGDEPVPLPDPDRELAFEPPDGALGVVTEAGGVELAGDTAVLV